MFNAQAFARAIRANKHAHLAFATIIWKERVIDDDMGANLKSAIDDVLNKIIPYNDIENCDGKAKALFFKE